MSAIAELVEELLAGCFRSDAARRSEKKLIAFKPGRKTESRFCSGPECGCKPIRYASAIEPRLSRNYAMPANFQLPLQLDLPHMPDP